MKTYENCSTAAAVQLTCVHSWGAGRKSCHRLIDRDGGIFRDHEVRLLSSGLGAAVLRQY